MPVRIVQSAQNSRLKELRRALRSPERKPGGLVGIEGPHLLEEALRAGLRMRYVFAGEGFERLMSGLRLPADTEMLVMPAGILASAFVTETPQAIAALIEAPERNWADLLGKSVPALVVILAGLQDPGNLGTIVRSAEAFGASGVVMLPGTVSPWNQKAMRASAGSVFRMPLIQAGVEECFTRLHDAGISTLSTAMKDAKPADSVDFMRATAIVIGNEGNGVPGEIAARADGAVTIPCPGTVESLNASIAASILLYEASRQRSAPSRPKGSGP